MNTIDFFSFKGLACFNNNTMLNENNNQSKIESTHYIHIKPCSFLYSSNNTKDTQKGLFEAIKKLPELQVRNTAKNNTFFQNLKITESNQFEFSIGYKNNRTSTHVTYVYDLLNKNPLLTKMLIGINNHKQLHRYEIMYSNGIELYRERIDDFLVFEFFQKENSSEKEQRPVHNTNSDEQIINYNCLTDEIKKRLNNINENVEEIIHNIRYINGDEKDFTLDENTSLILANAQDISFEKINNFTQFKQNTKKIPILLSCSDSNDIVNSDTKNNKRHLIYTSQNQLSFKTEAYGTGICEKNISKTSSKEELDTLTNYSEQTEKVYPIIHLYKFDYRFLDKLKDHNYVKNHKNELIVLLNQIRKNGLIVVENDDNYTKLVDTFKHVDEQHAIDKETLPNAESLNDLCKNVANSSIYVGTTNDINHSEAIHIIEDLSILNDEEWVEIIKSTNQYVFMSPANNEILLEAFLKTAKKIAIIDPYACKDTGAYDFINYCQGITTNLEVFYERGHTQNYNYISQIEQKELHDRFLVSDKFALSIPRGCAFMSDLKTNYALISKEATRSLINEFFRPNIHVPANTVQTKLFNNFNFKENFLQDRNISLFINQLGINTFVRNNQHNFNIQDNPFLGKRCTYTTPETFGPLDHYFEDSPWNSKIQTSTRIQLNRQNIEPILRELFHKNDEIYIIDPYLEVITDYSNLFNEMDVKNQVTFCTSNDIPIKFEGSTKYKHIKIRLEERSFNKEFHDRFILTPLIGLAFPYGCRFRNVITDISIVPQYACIELIEAVKREGGYTENNIPNPSYDNDTFLAPL